MQIEIGQAVDFLGRLLHSKLDPDVINSFKEALTELLKVRFQDHWDPQQPYRGNGFRALSNFNGQLDPILTTASVQASIQPTSIHSHLPRDFVLWIDPFSVSYRVGDYGNIMTLFEDRARGKIQMNNSPLLNSTTLSSQSPSQSPIMSFIQPRTFTPIRISPPNSPESILGQQQSTLNKKNNQDKPNKGLVMAI